MKPVVTSKLEGKVFTYMDEYDFEVLAVCDNKTLVETMYQNGETEFGTWDNADLEIAILSGKCKTKSYYKVR